MSDHETAGRDPGPLARLEAVKSDPTTMGVVVQRLADGETLKAIARSWQIPYGKFAEWIVEDSERSAMYSGALKLWGDALAQEVVQIADEVEADRDAVAKAKLQAQVRMQLAGKWNRERYGESTEVKHTGSVSLVAILSGLPRGREIDVTPAGATGALPSPAAPDTVTLPQTAPDENVPAEKIAGKTRAEELI